MRKATAVVVLAAALSACTDLRDYRGEWHGHRVGDAAPLRVGVTDTAEADISVDMVDRNGLHATLSVDKLVGPDTVFASLPGAEADKLANLSFAGDPIRVYLGFVATTDGAGDAMAMIALYDEHRIELRILRGGTKPLYGVFELEAT